MNPATIESRLREFLTANAEREGIAAAYLFGSLARGTARPESDVDVGVLYSEEPPATLQGLGLDLEGQLEGILKQPVQVVVLNRAPVDLVRASPKGVSRPGSPSSAVLFRAPAWQLRATCR